MTKTRVIGNFQQEIIANHQLCMMDFFLHDIPQNQHKQTRCLSVAFIADYLTALFSVFNDENVAREKQWEVKSATSYILNELLENSIKFKDETSKYPVKIGCCLCNRVLVFISTNSVNETVLNNFCGFINELVNSNTEELYFQQLEKGAQEKSDESRLGFLTMINDYGAKLGWKIETSEQDAAIFTITTMVQLSI